MIKKTSKPKTATKALKVKQTKKALKDVEAAKEALKEAEEDR